MAEEYYDFETETLRRRSLAEESLSEQMRGIARTVSKTVSIISDAVDAFLVNDTNKLKDLTSQSRRLKELTESMKEDALTYLARLGSLLLTNALYRSAFLKLTSIAQQSEGLVYRLYVMSSNSIQVTKDIRELLTEFANLIVKEYEKLETSIEHLTSNPKKSYEEAHKILSIEESADDIYRKLTFQIYKEAGSNMIGVLLLRDVAEMLEEIADLIRDTSEDVKFLALHGSQKQ